MSSSKYNFEGEMVLLVEGKNDFHVIMALGEKYNIPQNFKIYNCEGDEKVLEKLNALIPTAIPPKVIGLVLDADNPNLSGRWLSIQSKLAYHKCSLPEKPNPNGTIIKSYDDIPRLGIWLMPNNHVDGMLEDFCCEMISEQAISTVEECINIATERGHTSFIPNHHIKAVVHTYLAWQDEPGKPLGQSITSNALRSNTPTANTFAAWLKDLFDEENSA